MSLPRLLLVVYAVALASGQFIAHSKTDDPAKALALMAGDELIQSLQRDDSRLHAFYELWRRAFPAEDKGFESFEEDHYDPKVVVCPQPPGKPPIYLVLYGSIDRFETSEIADYRIENPRELFPIRDLPKQLRGDAPAIEAFTATGQRITPFGGDNLLEGVLADINGDGIVERVELTHYGIDGRKNVDVLHVWAVRQKAEPLLTVLVNWGADEWTYRVHDADKNGVSEIELGPQTDEGPKPTVVFKWDASKRAYSSSMGLTGDHFRVLRGENTWKELERLKSNKFGFKKDPNANRRPDERSTPKEESPPPLERKPAAAYHYTSLASLSDQELLRYMGRGKSAYDREREAKIPNHLPPDFWTSDPKKAALALVNANRKPQHRAEFALAMENRDKAQPPPQCTIAFSDSSSRCYNAIDEYYFLRVDPQESYLAYARSWSGGVVFYNFVHDQPAFDLRLCPLRYEDARQAANVIWWLDRVRSQSLRNNQDGTAEAVISTADGSGKITVRDNSGTILVERSGTLWADYLAERWSDDYDFQALLNFAAYVLTQGLTERLGTEWKQYEPSYSHDILERQDHAPLYADSDTRRLKDFAQRFLSWFTPQQDRISFAISAEAANAAGHFVMNESRTSLEAIRGKLPPNEPPKRSSREISAEEEKISQQILKQPKNLSELEKRRSALELEMTSVLDDSPGDNVSNLRRTIDISLRKIDAAHNPEKLFRWATSKKDGFQWALQRLSQIDPNRYSRALEHWMRKMDPKWARQLFAEMQRADPERAAAIAKELPPQRKHALAISAFSLLHDAGKLTDENARITTIIRIMHDPKSDWEEQLRTIDLLVPQDDALRYPDRTVDEAMLELLKPVPSEDGMNFAVQSACRALARRGRVEYFDRIAKTLERAKGLYNREGIVGALVHLAQQDPVQLNPRLLTILKPHLSQTNAQMSEILWSIWAADLRELKPDLERLATSSPEEYEDAKANSSGGDVTPISGRFHMARKIASIWNEQDVVTRARLLVSLAANDAYHLVGEPVPERVSRMRIELAQIGRELSLPQRQKITDFISRLNELSGSDELRDPESIRKIATFAREALGI